METLGRQGSARHRPHGITPILAAVERLIDEPFPRGCRKLHGSELTYRIRVGDYRIVYSVEDGALIIWVVRVGHRKEVYR